MNDLIRREDARLIALEYISDSMERHGALEAIRALPAVQPDAATAGLTARGSAATWALYDALLTRMGALQPDGHVNETPKSEHEAAVMLTPATKGGDA